MSGYEGSTYAELADLLAGIGPVLREARRARRLSMRSAAAQIGVPPSTVLRMERGEGFNSDSLLPVLRWLNAPLTEDPQR